MTSFSFEGIGLHTGELCSATIKPRKLIWGASAARIGPPSLWRRVREAAPLEVSRDFRFREVEIRPGGVVSAAMCTALGGVSTVEHLLGALAGLGLWSVDLEVDGPEIPILDGSALPFVERLPEGEGGAAPIRINKTISVSLGQARARIEPADSLSIDYSIEFLPPIGVQRLVYEHSAAAFREHIAPARTFTSLGEIEHLRSRGLIRGGSLDCAVVFAPEGVLNPPLRFADEPVRHKILDLLGDLALLGRPVLGRITVERGGHALHNLLALALEREVAGDPVA